MARVKKRRTKAYKPKGQLAMARGSVREQEAINRRLPAFPDVTEACLAHWLSLVALKFGAANEAAWSTVVQALNLGMLLCEIGFGPDLLGSMVAAQDGAFRAYARAQRTGSFRLDGAGIYAVTRGIEIYDWQLQWASRHDLLQAEAAMYARMLAQDVYKLEAA